MKSSRLFFVCLFFILTFPSNAFVLKGHWLDSSEAYNPYSLFYDDWMNDAMIDSLTTDPISFNFGSCLAEMQPGSVTQQPVVNNGGLNSVGSPLLRYSRWYIYNSTSVRLWADAYAITLPPYDSSPETYHSFEITINDSTQYPWNINGGGSTGGVDINTIFRHEAGHAFGIAHSISTQMTLMSNGDKFALENFPWLPIGTDEINALEVIFDDPTTTLRNNVIIIGDSIISDINFPVPDFLTYPELSFHCYIYRDNVIQNTSPFVPYFVEYLPNDYSHYTLKIPTADMDLGTYTIRTYSALEWNPTGDITLYETHHRPYSEVSFRVVANPEIQNPIQDSIHYVRPTGGKGAVTDSILIKVKVPEVLGTYPAINIKIDGTYVNQGDITFDSTEDVWVYNWDTSAVSPSEYGKRYNIVAEIDGDTTDYDAVGIYLVEALFFEDFQTITDLTAAGWYLESYEFPVQDYVGWIIANDPVTGATNKVARSFNTYSTVFYYKACTPAITIPTATEKPIKLKYRLYMNRLSAPSTYSKMKFYVCNSNRDTLTTAIQLYPSCVDGAWVDIEYDLSAFAGQTVKLMWWHYYAGATACNVCYYCLNDIIVYQIPDIEAPVIDFIAGNSAEPNEDMNLNLQFNDNSDIESVTADYSIEGDNGAITLTPVKGTFNYTGTILAKDHECNGSISFKIVDGVGNETVSGGHAIIWAVGGGGVLSAPNNVVITQPTSSTISITWDLVEGATGYKVYSSTDPYGTFTEDTTGTFTESRKWEKTIDGTIYFYYVVATNALKKEEEDNFSLKIGHRVK